LTRICAFDRGFIAGSGRTFLHYLALSSAGGEASPQHTATQETMMANQNPNQQPPNNPKPGQQGGGQKPGQQQQEPGRGGQQGGGQGGQGGQHQGGQGGQHGGGHDR
jgi:hypothetical protein